MKIGFMRPFGLIEFSHKCNEDEVTKIKNKLALFMLIAVLTFVTGSGKTATAISSDGEAEGTVVAAQGE